MNIQTYENCIRTLENEIKSREHQRKSMEQTITQLDRDINNEIQKNKSLREQINFVVQTNQKIINEIHKFQQIIRQKDIVIQGHITTDKDRMLSIEALKMQKQALQQQVKQKDLSLSQKDIELIDLDKKLKKSLQSIEGYKNDLGQKRIQFTQLTEKYQIACDQNFKLHQNLAYAKKQYEVQRQKLTEKTLQTERNANTSSSELQQKIFALQTQLKQARQFHKNQVQTLQFHHESQLKQLLKQIKSLESKISSQADQIVHLKEEQIKIKQHYQVQIQNSDKVVNSLIEEINFLKEEKFELNKQKSLKIQETVQQICMMGEQLADKQAKRKAFEDQIKILKDQLNSKDKQIHVLSKEISKLNLQLDVTSKQNAKQKETVSNKNQEIEQLKKYIENLKRSVQTAEKEKDNLSKKSSKQIQNLKMQNLQLSKKLQMNKAELQKLRIKQVELEETIKFLSLQKNTTSSSKAELQALIKAHQFTIVKLQNMNEQTKKVVNDLNSLMKIKLAEIDSLQHSNLMFRKQKIEWIKKEQEYRKKIVEGKVINASSRRISVNESSFMSRPRQSYMQKGNQQRNRTHSMFLSSLMQQQFINAQSGNFVRGFRNKSMMYQNLSQPINTDQSNQSQNSISSSSEGSETHSQLRSIGALQAPHIQNAFKKSQVRTNKKSIDLSLNPPEVSAVTMLKNMKTTQEQYKTQEQTQNSLEKICESSKQRESQTDQKATKICKTYKDHLEQQNPVQAGIKQASHTFKVSLKKPISGSTYPGTPTAKDQSETNIEERSKNFTPQFCIQPQESDSHIQAVQSQIKSFKYDRSFERFEMEFNHHKSKENEQKSLISIPKKISPINSRISMKVDLRDEISEDHNLKESNSQNEISQLNDLKEKQGPLSHREREQQNSVEARNTVNGINFLLDRLNASGVQN